MEKRGLVNAYECYSCKRPTFTVLFRTGVTPAGATCPWCGGEMWSCWYLGVRVLRLASAHLGPVPAGISPDKAPLVITHAWYRPRPGEMHPLELEHVQRGGLLLETLGKAVSLSLSDDEPDSEEWKDWEPWLAERYGKAE